jgi:hypothetical protein
MSRAERLGALSNLRRFRHVEAEGFDDLCSDQVARMGRVLHGLCGHPHGNRSCRYHRRCSSLRRSGKTTASLRRQSGSKSFQMAFKRMRLPAWKPAELSIVSAVSRENKSLRSLSAIADATPLALLSSWSCHSTRFQKSAHVFGAGRVGPSVRRHDTKTTSSIPCGPFPTVVRLDDVPDPDFVGAWTHFGDHDTLRPATDFDEKPT